MKEKTDVACINVGLCSDGQVLVFWCFGVLGMSVDPCGWLLERY